jgi:hypothetical protein
MAWALFANHFPAIHYNLVPKDEIFIAIGAKKQTIRLLDLHPYSP